MLRSGYVYQELNQGGSLALACKGAVPQAAPVSRGTREWGTQRQNVIPIEWSAFQDLAYYLPMIVCLIGIMETW